MRAKTTFRAGPTFALCGVALAVGIAGARADAAPPGVTASVSQCHPAVLQADSYAVFHAQMAAFPGTKRMAVRFDLFQRTPKSGGFHFVQAPRLGVWRLSNKGIQVFDFNQDVHNLAAPAGYRAQVSYRWLGRKGRILRQAKRRTKICQIPDQRPDLVVGRVNATKGADAATANYSVVVRNDGRSDAGSFDVVLTVAGVAQPAQTVPALAAAGRTTLTFSAPKCAPGTQLQVTVDPDNRVAEARESNDVKSVPCA